MEFHSLVYRSRLGTKGSFVEKAGVRCDNLRFIKDETNPKRISGNEIEGFALKKEMMV